MELSSFLGKGCSLTLFLVTDFSISELSIFSRVTTFWKLLGSILFPVGVCRNKNTAPSTPPTTTTCFWPFVIRSSGSVLLCLGWNWKSYGCTWIGKVGQQVGNLESLIDRR